MYLYLCCSLYVAGFAVCQQMKIDTHPTSPGLIPIKGQRNATLFSQVTCNFITDLLISDDYNSLMVIVDHGSIKEIISISCHKTIDTSQTATNYIKHMFKQFGLPGFFLSDRKPQFFLQVFSKIIRLLGVKILRSTVYHLQTDGKTE